MSRTSKAGQPGTLRDTVRHALDQAGPVAKNTSTAVRHGVTRSRAWAAPQMERTGEFLQEVAAPKVSDALSSAARKIEPAQPGRRRWMRRAGTGLLAAIGVAATAAGAAAAVLRKNGKPAAGETAEHTSDDAASEAQTPQHIAGA
jgi:hypothetical protein